MMQFELLILAHMMLNSVLGISLMKIHKFNTRIFHQINDCEVRQE